MGNGLYVMGITRFNHIYYRKGLNGKWKRLNGEAKYIALSWDSSHIWAVTISNNVYYRNGFFGKWIYVSGKLKQICVLNNGLIWGVNSQNFVYAREKGLKGSPCQRQQAKQKKNCGRKVGCFIV